MIPSLSSGHVQREKERDGLHVSPQLYAGKPHSSTTLLTLRCILFATSNRDAEASPLLLHESLNGVS